MDSSGHEMLSMRKIRSWIERKLGVKCPSCGRKITDGRNLGKTKGMDRGKIASYDVILCKCGAIYKRKS